MTDQNDDDNHGKVTEAPLAAATTAATNITWHDQKVSKDSRWKVAGHGGALLWFTGKKKHLNITGRRSAAGERKLTPLDLYILLFWVFQA